MTIKQKEAYEKASYKVREYRLPQESKISLWIRGLVAREVIRRRMEQINKEGKGGCK